MKNDIKTVISDGEETRKLQCPGCGQWGYIDDDQYRGKVSIECECGFHKTINLEEEV